MTPYTFRTSYSLWCMALLAVLITSCKSTLQPGTEGLATPQKLSEDASLIAWANLINGTLDDLTKVYVDQAVFMNAKGPVVLSAQKYLQEHQSQYGHITAIYTQKRILARENRGYHYEIGGFTTAKQQEFKHLLILKQQGDTLRRELEFIAKVAPTDSALLTEIDERRKEWMRLCNAHNAENLVKNLYTADAMYYNHKPLIVGHEGIAKDYQYMNREQYTLTLTPIIVEPVNEQLVYEVGQCSGSYGGKYMLVWQKDEAGQWAVLMDSNI